MRDVLELDAAMFILVLAGATLYGYACRRGWLRYR